MGGQRLATSWTGRWTVTAASASLALAALIGTATPAAAANSVSLTVLGGTVGVSQTVQASVSSDSAGQPSGTVTFTANDTAIGSATVGGTLGSTASVTWVPSAAGTTSVRASFAGSDATTVADSESVTIAKVSTTLTVTSAATSTTSTAVSLTARAAATQGSYVPGGNVTFYLANGTSLGRATLNASGIASLSYTTPSTAQTITYYAVYDGDASANSSRSADATMSVTAAASTIALATPAANTALQPVALTATLTPSSATGSVQFLIEGKEIATSTITSGRATATWTPTEAGSYLATAKYAGGSGVSAGTATVTVVVTAAQKTDRIVVDPEGTAPAWTPGSTITLPNGSSVPLTVTSTSKNKVSLSITGPCALSGNSLVVKGVGGACVLTAKTTGGNGYAAVTQTYRITQGIGTPSATIAAPASGTYRVGQQFRLGRVAATTSVGKQITWQARPASKKTCRVYVTGKNYKVKMLAPGTCTVTAKAPAVPGQWRQFKVVRTYSVVR